MSETLNMKRQRGNVLYINTLLKLTFRNRERYRSSINLVHKVAKSTASQNSEYYKALSYFSWSQDRELGLPLRKSFY